MADPVDRPALGWWLAVLGGFGLLAVVALSPAAYALWASRVTTALSRRLLVALLVVSIALHVGEALYARRLARTVGLAPAGWFWQTLALGFPSLRLLRERVRTSASR